MLFEETYDERVPLASVDLDGVDGVRLGVDRVGLDDGQIVVVDAEHVIGIAGHGYEAEAVAYCPV